VNAGCRPGRAEDTVRSLAKKNGPPARKSTRRTLWSKAGNGVRRPGVRERLGRVQ
jgi:hypothetical protein